MPVIYKRKWRRGVTLRTLGELLTVTQTNDLVWFKTKAIPSSFVLSMPLNYLAGAIAMGVVAIAIRNEP